MVYSQEVKILQHFKGVLLMDNGLMQIILPLDINRFIIEWGIVDSGKSTITITLPMTLTTQILAVSLQNYGGDTSWYAIDAVYNCTTTSFTANYGRGSQFGGLPSIILDCFWILIMVY